MSDEPARDVGGAQMAQQAAAKVREVVRRQSASGKVTVCGGWLIVDGCKVARVEPGAVIAFHDKCRRRSSERGTDQVRVDVHELMEAVERGESGDEEDSQGQGT